MNCLRSILLALALTAVFTSLLPAQPNVAPVEDAELGSTRNVHKCGTLYFAGQPMPDDISRIKTAGIKRVITLRKGDELDWNEAEKVEAVGLDFVAIPFREPDSLTDEVFDRVRQLLRDADKQPTLLHCGSANRVGAVWLAHRVLDQGVAYDDALREAKQIGLKTTAYQERARAYIRKQAPPASVRPGINDKFLDAELNVEEWIGRFEIESREVFAARHEMVKAIELKPGARLADIGAGTGLFTPLFCKAVGPEGWVFAVDISPKFVAHINHKAHQNGLDNVTTVLCPDNSVSLPADSIDVAFICDTYHHFEFPQQTLATIHRALRPGGQLILVDFERIPGKTREFMLKHVRAGKEVFRGEVEEAGFALVEEVRIDELKENYYLRFQKK